VSERSLSKWRREDAAPRPRGRPRTSAARVERAAVEVERAWKNQGQSGGVRTIRAALEGGVSWNLVRRCLAEIKRLHRARRRAQEADHRLCALVRGRDVMWSMDGTHLAHG
jgi:hypothetical protein